MNKKMIVLMTLFFVLFIPYNVHASSIQSYCVDNETLMEVEKSTITINGITEEVEINKTIKCEYGCIEGEVKGIAKCDTSGFTRELAFFIIVIIVLFGILTVL